MLQTPEELHAMCRKLYEDAHEPQAGAYYPLYLLAEFTHSLIDNLEITQEELTQAIRERDQAIAALKQAKKTLKTALKLQNPTADQPHDPKTCRYHTANTYLPCGRCLGTREMDPCEGPTCKRWTAK